MRTSEAVICTAPPGCDSTSDRISTHVALEEAAAMADRFNRLFLRTLRQLRDLRRYTPAVTIESAGQVNIGGQQISLTGEQSGA